MKISLPKNSLVSLSKVFIFLSLTLSFLLFSRYEPNLSWRFKLLMAAIIVYAVYLLGQQKFRLPSIFGEFFLLLFLFSSFSAERLSFLAVLLLAILFSFLFSLIYILFPEESIFSYQVFAKLYRPLLIALFIAESLWLLSFWQTHPLNQAAAGGLLFYLLTFATENQLSRQNLIVILGVLITFLIIVATMKWGII
jgi:hypothetical protein